MTEWTQRAAWPATETAPAKPQAMILSAYGGTVEAWKKEGKWLMRWVSDDGSVILRPGVHYLARFGLDDWSEVFAERMACASFNGLYSIGDHMAKAPSLRARWRPFAADPTPGLFIGPDPF